MSSEEEKVVKQLRPWVRISAVSVVALTAYSIFRAFLYTPRPHLVQFDLKRIEDMREGRLSEE